MIKGIKEEVLDGEGLAVDVAAESVHVHRCTVHKWITMGLRQPSGEIIRLEAVRLGGSWFTSRAALSRFIDATNPAVNDQQPAAAAAK